MTVIAQDDHLTAGAWTAGDLMKLGAPFLTKSETSSKGQNWFQRAL